MSCLLRWKDLTTTLLTLTGLQWSLQRQSGKRSQVPTGFYELTIDDRSQYEQRNANGEGRSVVLHNKDFKPYQVYWLLPLLD
jgi:hypothetical protein